MHRTAEASQLDKLNFVEAPTQDDPTLLLAQNEVEEHNDMWFLDSEISNHMWGKKELFSNMEEIKENTSLDDSSKLNV
jgi:hypothetical protein